jgi:sulfite exporter TauE/SafE
VHSEKGAKRVKSIAKGVAIILMGLKAAANQFYGASGMWSTLAWVIQVTRQINFSETVRSAHLISVRCQADSFQPKL